MHAFRLFRELIERARTAAKSRSDFLRRSEVSIQRRFLLRRISQTMTASASKQPAGGIKHRCAATAAATDEPRALTTEMEARPSDGNLLKDRLRLSRPQTKRLVNQNHSVMLREREHFTERLALARP